MARTSAGSLTSLLWSTYRTLKFLFCTPIRTSARSPTRTVLPELLGTMICSICRAVCRAPVGWMAKVENFPGITPAGWLPFAAATALLMSARVTPAVSTLRVSASTQSAILVPRIETWATSWIWVRMSTTSFFAKSYSWGSVRTPEVSVMYMIGCEAPPFW